MKFQKLLNDYIELDLKQSDLDSEKLVDGVWLTGIAYGKNNATMTAKIKNIDNITAEKTGLSIGDNILIDRWAIVQCNKFTDQYAALININSILGKQI